MILSDAQIDALLTSEKTVSNAGTKGKEQRGAKQKNYHLICADGEKMTLFTRQNIRIPENFSCGLIYCPPQGGSIVLTRYNGSDHSHFNPIEGDKIVYRCHIHRATHRYMEMGKKPEHYAEATNRFSSLDGAILALVKDCNIRGLTGNDDDQKTGDLFD